MGNNPNKNQLTEVWGDTVNLRELLIASIIGVVITMGAYLIGRHIFSGMPDLSAGVAKGYALLVGICGCITSGAISAKLFKPKRVFFESQPDEKLEDILLAAGITAEEEAAALSIMDPEIIAEMEELELYSLLSLIPENSPNFKPIYKEKAVKA